MRLAAAQAQVLLVEEDEALRKITSICLKRRGYQVLETGSAEEALALLEGCEGGSSLSTRVDQRALGSAPQLVVTDSHLPGLSGLELLRALRAREIKRADGTPLPVVFFANPAPQLAREARALGSSVWLAKPCTFQNFTQTIAQWAN